MKFQWLLLLAFSCWLHAFAGSEDSVINVPRLNSGPVLAAPLNSGAWNDCARFYGFSELQTGNAAATPTRVLIGEYNDTLYVAVECDTAPGAEPRAEQKKHDGKVFIDDSVDLCLAIPGKAPAEYYQLSLNSINTRYDSYQLDPSWNGKWESAAIRTKSSFIVYFAIPFADLGYEGTPDAIRLNLARTVVTGKSEFTVWIRENANGYFPNAQKGALLRFRQNKIAHPVLAIEQTAGEQNGAFALLLKTPELPPEGFADTKVTVVDRKGNTVAEKEYQTRFDSKIGILDFGLLPDGEYRVTAIMQKARVRQVPAYYSGGGKAEPESSETPFVPAIYTSHSWGIHIDHKPSLTPTVTLEDSGRKLVCHLAPVNLPAFQNHPSVTFSIRNPAGGDSRMLGKMAMQATKQVSFAADVAWLPERSRQILDCALMDGDRVVVSHAVPFATPPAPFWQKPNPDDPAGKVLAPWTPVKLNGLTVSVWGREYQFSKNSPVPLQITSQRRELLSSPVRLHCSVPISWTLDNVIQQGDDCVRLDWTGRAGNSRITAFAEIMMDGAGRFDISLPEEFNPDSLWLELPCRKEIAAFVHRAPVMFGGVFNTYPFPEKTEYQPIRENVFLLDDKGGLCWFDGMKFDWPLKEPQKAIAFLPRPAESTVRVTYIDRSSPNRTPGGRTFSFGLQATPVRPMDKLEKAMRVCYAVKYGDEDVSQRQAWLGTVDYDAKDNFNAAQGTVEFKVKPGKISRHEYFFQATHGEYYRLSIGWTPELGVYADIYEYGLKARIQTGFQLPPETWTHVALTWQKELALWINGKKMAQTPFDGSLKVFPAMLKAGGVQLFLDDLRISNIPRSVFATDSSPEVDANTMLCDTFDQHTTVNGRPATIPAKISNDAECGYLMPDTVLSAGFSGQGVAPMKRPPRSMIEGYAQLGIDTMIYHASQYTDEAFSGLYIHEPEKFARNLAAIHRNGMRALIYVGNSISTLDRLWDTYADQWLIEPRQLPFVTPTRPNDKGYQACPRSDYFKYFVSRIGTLMDQWHLDGFFLDGRMYATCSNEKHGCGVKNFDGKIVPERDIWDGRKKQLFLYNVARSRNLYAEEHKSGNWDAPICFLWDGAWEGEQFMSASTNGRKRTELCPLIAMRAQMNGIPYGVPSRFTSYNFAPFTPLENATFAFVHGTTSAMTYRIDEAHVISPYWKALDQYQASYSNFKPYWGEQAPTIATPDPMVKVSAYGDKKRALLIVANFNEDQKEISGTYRLNPDLFETGEIFLRDVFDGESIPVSPNGEFTLNHLKSFRQRWIALEKKP